jgi:AcrR family transcriptional regulator
MVEMYKEKNQEIEVRNVIIHAARKVFARYGFRKTTMQDIAAAAGKAKSSLYHYFKSKEDIFHSVLEKEVGILKEQILASIKKEKTAQKKLIAYFVARMYGFKKVINFYSAFSDEYLENYGFIQRMRRDYDQYEISMIRAMLSEGVDEGSFTISNPQMTAAAILTALKGMEYQWAVEQDVEAIEKNIRNMANVLFYGIVKR